MKAIVVTRKLASYSNSVISTVIGHPDDLNEAIVDVFLERKADEHIANFIKNAPEFSPECGTTWNKSIHKLE